MCAQKAVFYNDIYIANRVMTRAAQFTRISRYFNNNYISTHRLESSVETTKPQASFFCGHLKWEERSI